MLDAVDVRRKESHQHRAWLPPWHLAITTHGTWCCGCSCMCLRPPLDSEFPGRKGSERTILVCVPSAELSARHGGGPRRELEPGRQGRTDGQCEGGAGSHSRREWVRKRPCSSITHPSSKNKENPLLVSQMRPLCPHVLTGPPVSLSQGSSVRSISQCHPGSGHCLYHVPSLQKNQQVNFQKKLPDSLLCAF